MAGGRFSFMKCVFIWCTFIFAGSIYAERVPGVGATSTGQRSVFNGRRDRRSADQNSTAYPRQDFFLDEIVAKFGVNGKLNQEQLTNLLERVNAECYSSTELLSIHSFTEEQLLNDTTTVVAAVCPTVLYQSASDDCVALDDEPNKRQPPTVAQVWGYGILFVTIINLSSLMGVCIIPCMDKKIYKNVLTYLIGLAVGTLSGNALLSLIPETHGMTVGTHGLNFVWRNTTILGGIYLFFVVERILKLISLRNDSKDHRLQKKSMSSQDIVHVTAMHDVEQHRDIYKITSGDSALGLSNGTTISAENGITAGNKDEIQNGHGHSHMALTEDGKIRIASVAYMIVFGDGLHNFVDGLAIGASFAISVFQGISTSIAVICEEFPHELGDFAILLKSGMKVKQALMFNFLSALTCYGGLIVGIIVGQLTSAEPYIFALAGGMFLYISLVDMLPELNAMTDQKNFNMRNSLKIFVIQNAGLLTGYSIMILLAVYGEHIQI